jgi:SAM-dependent methyltransferase
MELDDAYWSNRYLNNTAAWDAGNITTPIREYIDQLTDKNSSILIPGCGNSYEAAYLLQQGFTNITLIDISTVLCKSLEQKFAPFIGKSLTIVCADFFEHKLVYDLVIEQTFFSALPPIVRNKYAEAMRDILKPGGKLVGLLFNREFEGGPPFGGTENEYRELFHGRFSSITMSSCYNSIAARKDAELFIKMIK